MPKFEHRDNTAILFDNENKTKDNQPDFTGKGKFQGIDIEVAGWSKLSQGGKKMISMNIKEKEDFRA